MELKMQTPVDNYHVTPVGDLKDHVESDECWCNPEIEDIFDDGFPPYTVVHKAADGRESGGWKTKKKVKIDSGYLYNLRSLKGH